MAEADQEALPVTDLHTKILVLCAAYDVDWAEGYHEQNVPGCSPADAALEHLVHELSHAALLGMVFGPELSERVGHRLRQRLWCTISDANEVSTFAVEIDVLRALGAQVDEVIMAEACRDKVPQLSVETIRSEWEIARTFPAHGAAVRKVMYAFSDENVETRVRWLQMRVPFQGGSK